MKRRSFIALDALCMRRSWLSPSLEDRAMVYAASVASLKAHVMNRRIVVDEPVDLPEGAEIQVYLYDGAADPMSREERAALERALERSLAQAVAGDLIDADEVLAEPQRP
jgi:hypothetical protein